MNEAKTRNREETNQSSRESTGAQTTRRRALVGVAASAGLIAAPSQWTAPVIKSVMLPAHAATSALTIVDIAVGAAPEFTSLVGALTSTGLVPTLQGPGPFTVFAPTNAAFAAISGTVATLTTDQVRNILLYHVLSGVQPPSAIPPTSGTPASVQSTINASNGVIYVIDQVLLP